MIHQKRRSGVLHHFFSFSRLWRGLNPRGRELLECPVDIRVAHGPKATERGAEEKACKRSAAGGQAPDDPAFFFFACSAQAREGAIIFYCFAKEIVIE